MIITDTYIIMTLFEDYIDAKIYNAIEREHGRDEDIAWERHAKQQLIEANIFGK